MNILIVEDNAFDYDLTSRKLNDRIEPCTISHAATFKEAKKAITTAYDVVLLDYKLPDGYGIHLIPLIIQLHSETIIIMLTGAGNEEVAVAALQQGADDYIVKKEGYLDIIADTIVYHLEKTPTKKREALKPIHVLYLEHHSADIDLTLLHFKRYAPNFKFSIVTASYEMLQLLHKKPSKYDVLLIDYKMPGLDALDITKHIKQELQLDYPIVIITGQGNDEIAIQALKLGVTEYLVKRENYIFKLPSLLTSAYQKVELNRKNKLLKESEEMFRGIFEEHAATKVIIDPYSGQIFAANNAAAEYYGWTVEALKKMTVYDISPYQAKIVTKILEKSRLLGKFQSETKHKHADGTVSDVLVFSSKVIIKEKEYLHAIIYDISKRKIAERQLKLLSTAIEQSPVSIVITNHLGNIEYVNPFFTENTGYTWEDAYGNNLKFLNSGVHEASFFKHLWDTITTGSIWQGEICNKKKNGTIFWENVIIAPIYNDENNITHFIGVKEDITEKRQIVQELIEAKEKAEESDRLKTAFLHNISHEIRTPLNAIVGFSSIIAEATTTSKKFESFSNIIKNSSDHLLLIVDDILKLSTIEAGQEKLFISKTAINEKCKLLFEEFQSQRNNRSIEFEFHAGLPDAVAHVALDEVKFLQILTNLLANAFKFTQKGRISFGYQLKGDQLEFYVKDTGIGIAPTYHEQIFERFRKVDIKGSKIYRGSGIGLAISKAYAEMQGGKIWLQSEEGKGATFYVRLPYHPIQAQATTQVLATDTKTEGTHHKSTIKTILIAEDEEFNFMYINALLSGEDYSILRAVNGLEAIELCTNKAVDLVLMDIKMPLMNGLEATKKIKAAHPNLPIIAQTAYSTDNDQKKAFESGCDDFISKPFNKEDLLVKIMHYLSI